MVQVRSLVDPSTLPDLPGVYLYLDENDEIIYVGKAKSLVKRVKSYFRPADQLDPKTRTLMSLVRGLRYVVVQSEMEALILENRLIKRHKPRYNIRLKDDSTYPYIHITLSEAFPRILKSRPRRKKKGDRYFGPYPGVRSIDRIIAFLCRAFGICNCRNEVKTPSPERIGSPGARGCLNFQMGRCLGPCRGVLSTEEYFDSAVKPSIRFLETGGREYADELRTGMAQASMNLNFEKAAWFRDLLKDLDTIGIRQHVEMQGSGASAVIGLASNEDITVIALVEYEDGELADRKVFTFGSGDPALAGLASDFLASFVQSYYDAFTGVMPRELLLPFTIADQDLIQQWMSDRSGRKVVLHAPERGVKNRQVALARLNAMEHMNRKMLRMDRDHRRSANAAAARELKECLGLHRPPSRIVCFDISNLGTQEPVAGMTCFVDGEKARDGYRKFAIRDVDGQDDFAMINQALTRFLSHVHQGEWPEPDLVLIDGGLGQLGAAMEAMERAGEKRMALASLAKKREEVFIPGRRTPVLIPEDSPAHLLLRRIRDETHRYAITFHRQRRSKVNMSSLLDRIEGIGPGRRKKLLRVFGSLEAIAAATQEELQKAGLPLALARRVREELGPRLRAQAAADALVSGDGVTGGPNEGSRE